MQGDARQLPFEDGFFDTVVCINFFICQRSPEDVRRILFEAARVLSPGGRLIVEIRNRNNILLRLKYGLARYYDGTLEDNPLALYDPAWLIRRFRRRDWT